MGLTKKNITLVVGLLLLCGPLILGRAMPSSWAPSWSMLMVALVMAMWWIFETLPLGVTAMLPLVSYPLFGIMPTSQVAPVYMTSVLFLFIGGFLVAIAMQKSNLHRRMALRIIGLFGNQNSKIILGFMLATFFLSMWISNTATTVMMVSIAMAVIKSYEDLHPPFQKDDGPFASGLMLAIAYSASAGGMATLVGTPPNLAFSRIYSLNFPQSPPISFSQWFLWGLPVSLLVLLLAWAVLVKVHFGKKQVKAMGMDIIHQQRSGLGPMGRDEKWVLIVFVLMIFLWTFRMNMELGFFTVPGWSLLLSYPEFVNDSTTAIFCASLLFIIPSEKSSPSGDQKILQGADLFKVPWDTILLFGGGFALAEGMRVSGLSEIVGKSIAFMAQWPDLLVTASITLGITFWTEIISNMASTEMLLPILAGLSKVTEAPPLPLMVPLTLGASCAFMLPAATAPNAIVFGSGRVRVLDMVRLGIFINLGSVLIITILSPLLVRP